MPSASARKFLARDLLIDINTGSIATPTWTPILGLTSLTHAPSTERADAGGFDTGGRKAHMVAERGDTWTLEGHKKVDPTDGAGDAGQEAVETLALAIGTAAEGQFRLTVPGTGADSYTFMATADATLPGGGTNDLAEWGAVIEVTGAVTKA